MFQSQIFSPFDTLILLELSVCWGIWELVLWETLQEGRVVKGTLRIETEDLGGPAGLLVTSPVTRRWLLNLYRHRSILICNKSERNLPVHLKEFESWRDDTYKSEHCSLHSAKYKPSMERCLACKAKLQSHLYAITLLYCSVKES